MLHGKREALELLRSGEGWRKCKEFYILTSERGFRTSLRSREAGEIKFFINGRDMESEMEY